MKSKSFLGRAIGLCGMLAFVCSCVGCGNSLALTTASEGLSATSTARPRSSAAPTDDLLVSVDVTETSTTGAAPTAADKDWGDLSGQFILDGDIPAVEEIDASKEALCAGKVKSEELVVNTDNKGIRYVFIFPNEKNKPKKVHPDLKESKEKTIVLDQEKCAFKPHGLFVRTDQTVQVISSDSFNHNTRTSPIRNQPLNVILTGNDKKGIEVKFAAGAERLPMQVKCDIHAWMSAWWLILDHPYGAITDADGKFTIPKLPVGDHEFRVWHEFGSGFYIDKEWKVTIKAGENKVAPIKLPVAKFAKK